MRTAYICFVHGRNARGFDLETALELARGSWCGRPLLRDTARLTDEAGEFAVLHVSDDTRREWVFRFPLTSVAAVTLDQELQLLDRLARRLPAPIPLPVALGVLPGDRTFAGYPHIRGVPCLPGLLQGRRGDLLVSQLAGFLAVLHTTPVGQAVDTGLPETTADSWRTAQAGLVARAERQLPLPTPVARRWDAALGDDTLWPDRLSLTHGDLNPRHVLVEQDRAVLSGVMAWGKARIADPAADFADLSSVWSSVWGENALDQVLAAYAAAQDQPPEPRLRRRAAFHASLQPARIALHGLDTGQESLVRQGITALRSMA